MEEKYKAFNEFKFQESEKWLNYLNNRYPPVKYNELSATKKAWYKKNVDKDFDVNYEQTLPQTQQQAPPQTQQRPRTKKLNVWKIQCVLNVAYIVLLFTLYTFRWWHAAPLMLSIFIGLANSHGMIRCSLEWWQPLLTDENTHNLIYVGISAYMCKSSCALKIPVLLHSIFFTLSCFELIIKKNPNGLIAKVFGNVVKKVDQNRANLEELIYTFQIYIGFYLIATFYPLKWTSMFVPLGYWYLMQFRYLLSFQTKCAFMKLGLQLESIKSHRLCPKPVGWLITGMKYVGGFFSKMAEQQQQAPPQQGAQPAPSSPSCIIF
jgi:hypothetical protein